VILCSAALAAGIDTYIAGMTLVGVIVICAAAAVSVRCLYGREQRAATAAENPNLENLLREPVGEPSPDSQTTPAENPLRVPS
jgi:hypothetical protein